MTFAEKYCAKTGVHPADFESVVLRLSLKPAARLFRPLLNLDPDYFSTDREFVREIGRISRLTDFDEGAYEFPRRVGWRGFFRRTLGLRLSRTRLRRLVREYLR